MKRLVASLMLTVTACVSADAQVYPIGDLNEDWRVDARDLRIFAEQWLDDNCLEPGCVADLNGAAGVNG
ncbi:MAG TPA: hypothetical protein ENN81_04060, partial [Phycisphaerales bacterium]|nr:hypothetical protein [Phycisphaerales bacterium]